MHYNLKQTENPLQLVSPVNAHDRTYGRWDFQWLTV